MLAFVAAGLSTRDIASELSISVQGVTYHVGNLLAKFGSANRAGMIGRAYALGYIAPGHWPPRAELRGRSMVLLEGGAAPVPGRARE